MSQVAIFDKIASKYDDNRGGAARGARFAEKIAPHLIKDHRVLDLGAGTGVVAAAIAEAGFEVTGIDLSKEMLKHAVDRVRNLVWGDMSSLPFIDGYFGSVYSVWALHLAGDVPKCVGEVRRVLSSGGRFVTCPAANPPRDPIGKIIWEMQYDLVGDELLVDSPKRLSQVAADFGFRFETTEQIEQSYQMTPNGAASMLESRSTSTLQNASDEQWTAIVEPTIAKLRAMDRPDEFIKRETIHEISVLTAVD